MANSTNQSTPQKQPPIEGEVLTAAEKKKLPPEIRKVVTMMQSYEGPLPPASEFAKYEKVHKGAADRIIGMAEDALKAEIKDRWWHNITVFWAMLSSRALLFILLAVSVVLLLMGQPIAALLTGIGPIIQGLFNIDFTKKGPQQKPSQKKEPAKKKVKTKKKKK